MRRLTVIIAAICRRDSLTISIGYFVDALENASQIYPIDDNLLPVTPPSAASFPSIIHALRNVESSNRPRSSLCESMPIIATAFWCSSRSILVMAPQCHGFASMISNRVVMVTA